MRTRDLKTVLIDADCNNNVVAPATIPIRKRKSEEDSSSERPSKYFQTSNSTSSSSDQALQNSLILYKIFKDFPTSFLLNSCSLVCKNWNSQARTFIRDNRKCTIATKPLRRCPCSIFKGFDEMCRIMTAAGRVAPFNSFAIKNYPKNCKCSKKNPRLGVIDQLLTDHLKLQYVTIDCQGWEECGNMSQLFLRLLRLKGNQVKSMEIEHADFFRTSRQIFMSESDEEIPNCRPQFCQLREVTVSYTKFFQRASQELFIRSLLKDAPNLKNILLKDSMALWLSKKDYKLMDKFKLSCTSIVLRDESRDLNCEIVKKQPRCVGKISMFSCGAKGSKEVEELLQECQFTEISRRTWVSCSETPWVQMNE